MTEFKQYFMDGCFDGYHYGHVNAILQGKLLCNNLILGTHNNDEMSKHKNDPLCDYIERSFMLKHCKYINNFIGDVNYIVSIDTLNKFNCSKYLHADEVLITRNGEDGINLDVIKNHYITYERTFGISTTLLISRLYNYFLGNKIEYNINLYYLKTIYNKTKKYNMMIYNNNNNIIYISHSWDLLNSIHIKQIQKIKDDYPNFNLIGIINNNNDEIYIYNQYERAITLSSINLIDDVIMDFDYINNEHRYINLDNDKKYFINFNKNHYINSIDFEKFLIKLIN